MIDNFSQGRVLKEGIDTIIIGKPNVGKSSLLNYLAGEELAIVTDVPGTTRDLIRQSVSFKGIPLNLIDTAGIRDTDDLVEKIGVKKSLDYISKADLIVFILDSSRKLSTEDFEIFDLLKEKSSRTITLLNKSDLENSLDLDAVPEKLKSNLITVSLKSGSGLDNLYSFISKIFFNNKVFDPEESLISNNRQLYLIKDALNSINLCLNSIDVGMTEDVFTIDLMDAYSSLGKVIGENVEDDLVDKVFSDFCMGK
jgi:tRNA modification GTPase